MKEKDTPITESPQEKLSSEELGMLRARLDKLDDRSQIPPPEKKKQSRLVKFAKNNTVATVIISILIFAVIASAILLGIHLSGTLGANSKRDYRFIYEQFGKNDEEIKLKYENIVINDVLYVDMNRLAEFAGLSVSGSEETMKYIASEEHYLKFTNDSEYAVINAAKVAIPAPAIIKDGKCLVPYQVISKAISGGIEFKLNQSRNTVNVIRKNYKVEDITYNEDVTFSYEKFTVVQAIQSTVGIDFEYNIDVLNYISHIDPEDSSVYLILVNSAHPLGEHYIPDTLSSLPSRLTAVGETYGLVPSAREALVAMMLAMEKDLKSNSTYVTSAYRSYSYQYDLFEKYVKNYTDLGLDRNAAESEVLKTVARPGTSEHQSGLCVDFITNSMTELNNTFENSAAFAWLSQNAHKYGFILRYPANKTDVTSYRYESWHYRFVGRTAATEMYVSGLCLEEYLELL